MGKAPHAGRGWLRMTLPWPVFVVTAVLVMGAASARAQTGQRRVAILFGSQAPYREAADALADELRDSGFECLSLELVADDEAERARLLEQAARFKPNVVATAGTGDTADALEAIPNIPTVFFMVPNARDAPFVGRGKGAGRSAGVTSDISPAEQIEWITRTSPSTRHVAVLCSPRSRRVATDLVEAGRLQGLKVSPVEARHDRFPDAIETLSKGGFDGVLMIPDAQVYNSPNVQRLLLWGVRQKKPVWTFSANVVKAGAFSGLYCDSSAVGRQAARIVEQIISGKTPGSIGLQYAEQVGRAVNVHTAEMIDAKLDDAVFTPEVVRMGER